MTDTYARDLWYRACNALRAAESLLAVSPDDAASRVYYAGFHAVSAAFALQGTTFRRHTALRTAVHRDLVKDGIWPVALGADFDAVWKLRDMGDYGGLQHVTRQEAQDAIEAVRRIIEAVRRMCPQFDTVVPKG